jgi:hypothetical protein
LTATNRKAIALNEIKEAARDFINTKSRAASFAHYASIVAAFFVFL